VLHRGIPRKPQVDTIRLSRKRRLLRQPP